MRKINLLAAFFLLAALGLLFAGGGQEEPAAIKMTVWINGADSIIGPTEQQKPQDQWYISQAFRRFEQANPGVSIELVVPPDQAGAHTNFKTAGLAGNAPDVANLWTGQPIFALKDVILPLDKLVPKDDLNKIWGWESVRDGFNPNGTILGYPAAPEPDLLHALQQGHRPEGRPGLRGHPAQDPAGVRRRPGQDQGHRRHPDRRGRGRPGRALVPVLGRRLLVDPDDGQPGDHRGDLRPEEVRRRQGLARPPWTTTAPCTRRASSARTCSTANDSFTASSSRARGPSGPRSPASWPTRRRRWARTAACSCPRRWIPSAKLQNSTHRRPGAELRGGQEHQVSQARR